jgi:hypothetical protein
LASWVIADAASLQHPLEVPQAVRATLDVEDVTAMQQAIEQSRRHRLVAGEDLGPVLDRFV